MWLGFSNRIWFYPKPVDFRKQMDGLIILVADQLDLKPTSGEIYIFRSRCCKKVKLLWWDRNGFWLFYKRLEGGRFQFPLKDDRTLELTQEQLQWLLSGLDCLAQKVLPTVTASHFF
jgi:transposase